ncbi:amine oxidase-like protein [Mytilinidion resinicola]|uniref:Amine oxidase-like protein n=1 Tax=Mytilinidion resinicola TaxID=574789 RepID=A0A6A6Y630_9PEZI|nr:amine oxidase-like protein [Mytilinidion resinicola]KAF2803464.1 amine oxidase-like protein [Mytilinidion resinicola]
MEKKRIAIVGSGISGLGALWTLRNSPHEVHLYEAADRLGGHTNTATFKYNGDSTPVDTGFIVLNVATYPNFIAFLNALNVKTIPSEMTFGVSRDHGAFEWSGTSLSSIFAQRENVFRPSFWRMIFDIVRFNLFALDLLSEQQNGASDAQKEQTIGEYLVQEGYSDSFRDDYIIPMTACVWSTGPDKCALEFPAMTLVRFMWNHHLLSTVAERPPWLTIEGGSQKYIDAVLKETSKATIHLSSPAISVEPQENGKVSLTLGGTQEAKTEIFDSALLACHGDQARHLISASATAEELRILSAFETTPNTAYLHSDLSLMPTRRTAWSAWNYLTLSSDPTTSPRPSPTLHTVSLTYNMNILQSLPTSLYGDVLVTLNPPHAPAAALTQGSYAYRHPLYNARAVQAQEELARIQGTRGVWYAGAWTGYGFHEDGFSSGIRAGIAVGGSVPWEVVDAKFVRGRVPVLGWREHVARLVVWVMQVVIGVLGRVLGEVMEKVEGVKSGRERGKVKGM